MIGRYFWNSKLWQFMSLNQLFCVFLSHGNLTTRGFWWVWLHLHCTKVSGPPITVDVTLQNTKTDKGQRFKLNDTVSSGSTAKSWSYHSTTPSFSSTSTSILIETLQMHVSHASLSLLLHSPHSYWLCLFHAFFFIKQDCSDNDLTSKVHPNKFTVFFILLYATW